MTETVRVAHVSKSYGHIAALADVSFALHEGETIALVGHNGAGKTTLIKLLLGLARPTAGTVAVLGANPAAGRIEARSRLGYLPENVSFNLALTGRETLAFYGRLKRVPRGDIAVLLERVGLTEAADRRIGSYSKGMRQRLGLAQALLGEPAVLLLDEPTTGLDPALRRSFYDAVDEIRSRGATILLSSHALTELEGRADRVIIVNRGVKIADGSIEDLRTIARLPTRIRVRLADRPAGVVDAWIGSTGPWRRINGHALEIDASAESKIELLRHATAADAPVADLEVMPPTLDELYAHFLGAQEQRR
jgi:Cu-processing system ATP-binding protein